MVKLFPVTEGNTLGCDDKIIKKLKKRGAKFVNSDDESEVTIVFCPIVSRFETDIHSALSNLSGKDKKVIVVAMHHTYDPNYTVPNNRKEDNKLIVSCLFYEKKGLLSCPCNKTAKKMVYRELGLPTKVFKIKTSKK